jgi:hypothetical protein
MTRRRGKPNDLRGEWKLVGIGILIGALLLIGVATLALNLARAA